MKIFAALLSGLLFGLGLAVSHMVDPDKVLSFLAFGATPSGKWDPSLAFVMGGALLVTVPAFYFIRGRSQAILGYTVQIPDRRDVDAPLVLGAVLFGAGWGLVGFCPGPAVAAIALAGEKGALFVVTMIAGMAIYGYGIEGKRSSAR